MCRSIFILAMLINFYVFSVEVTNPYWFIRVINVVPHSKASSSE